MDIKKFTLITCAVISIASAAYLSFQKASDASIDNSKIHWLTVEEAMQAHADDPKKLFFDMYTDWCGWCKVMDQKTFTNANVISTINENYYPIKFNAEQKQSVTFDGQQYQFMPIGRKGIHGLAYKLLDRRASYPSFVLLDENLDPINIIVGYQPPEQLLAKVD